MLKSLKWIGGWTSQNVLFMPNKEGYVSRPQHCDFLFCKDGLPKWFTQCQVKSKFFLKRPLLKIMDDYPLVNGGINYRQRLAEQILEVQRLPRIDETV